MGMLALMPHAAPTTTAIASFDKRLPTVTASTTANTIPANMIPFFISSPILNSQFKIRPAPLNFDF
jgi:hypothetical protein